MAEKKKSAKKKTTKATKESKETQSKETKAKKSQKSTKKEMVKLSFRPLFSAAKNYTVSLTNKKVILDNGVETVTRLPAIEGLPRLFTIKAGEIVSVTQEQFEQLKQFDCIETEEQLASRKALEAGVSGQHPSKITYDMHERQIDSTLNSRTSSKIYNDKFIVVD